MVIVDRQADAYIDIVGDTHGEVEVAGKSAVNSTFFHIGIPDIKLTGFTFRIGKLTSTGKTPVIGSDSTTGTRPEMEKSERVRVLLVKPRPTPKQASLSEDKRLREG